MTRGWGRAAGLSVLALLCAAPTPGDIGGCGQAPDPLDPGSFAREKQALDCQRCTECRHRTQTCVSACADPPPTEDVFPEGCVPLLHDGFVCLRALEHASCDDYRTYVDDDAPALPTECNFCPPEAAP